MPSIKSTASSLPSQTTSTGIDFKGWTFSVNTPEILDAAVRGLREGLLEREGMASGGTVSQLKALMRAHLKSLLPLLLTCFVTVIGYISLICGVAVIAFGLWSGIEKLWRATRREGRGSKTLRESVAVPGDDARKKSN